MTIRELIEQLQAFPPDMPVLVDGYEGGLSDAKPPELQEVIFNHNAGCSYLGVHELSEYYMPEYAEPGKVPNIGPAVVISR